MKPKNQIVADRKSYTVRILDGVIIIVPKQNNICLSNSQTKNLVDSLETAVEIVREAKVASRKP